MSHEVVLDIGIGAGGEYITENTAAYEQRVGIDIDRWTMSPLQRNHPDVLPVLGSAESLPFSANSFSRIETILPLGELMLPGLQNDHFALNEKYRSEYVQTHPDGWYAEFYRVLRPQGKLVIFGDLWINPEQVQRTSQRFFTVEHVQQLTESEFRALGTSTVPTVINNIRRNSYIKEIKRDAKDTLVKINLRSKK